MSNGIAPGIHPFWFWNAPIDEDLIHHQIAAMAAAGCRGVFIHPRQGMQVPYLSPRFFTLIKCAIDACVVHGLQAHLYDEFPYPAGIAGGLVTMGRPELQATQLRHYSKTFASGRISMTFEEGAVLVCQAIPRSADNAGWDWGAAIDLRQQIGVSYQHVSHCHASLSQYCNRRFFVHDPQPVLEVELDDAEYLLCAAIQQHVQWHKYWNHYVDTCNPEAMRLFMQYTHERYAHALGREYLQHVVGWFVDEIHPSWSRLMPAAWQERHAESIDHALIALQQPEHPRHQERTAQYKRLQYDLFVDAFERPVSAWCREHGLQYIVEKPQLFIEQLSYADVPGCDNGHSRAGVRHDLLGSDLRHNARATASAAQVYNKSAALCEGFHSLGWSATLEDIRLLSDNLMLHGVACITPHAFYASSHGLRKHDAAPSFFLEQSWWPLFSCLTQRLNKLSTLLGSLQHAADAVLIDPGIGRHDETAGDYSDFLHQLSASACEFLIVDASFICAQDAQQGCIRAAERNINNIILYADPDPGVQQWLEQFAAAGGRLHQRSIPETTSELSLSCHAAPELAAQIHQARFTTPAGDVLFAINNNATTVTLSLPAEYTVLDPDTLQVLPVQDKHMQLDTYAAFVLVASTHPSLEQAHTPAQVIDVAPVGDFLVKREQSNLLRLDDWQINVCQNGRPCGSGQVAAKTVIEQLHDCQAAIVYDYQQRFGQQALLHLPALEVAYEHRFHNNAVDGALMLLWEDSSFSGSELRMLVNDSAFSMDDAAAVERLGHGGMGIDISRALQEGMNTIRIDMQCQRKEDGLLNALFLAGDFDSSLQPFGISSSKAQRIPLAEINDLDAIGASFYDGVLALHGAFELTMDEDNADPDDPVAIALPQLVGEAYTVQWNDAPEQPLLWAPRRVCLPRHALHSGVNSCIIKRYGNLGRRFDGQRFDYAEHRLHTLTAN